MPTSLSLQIGATNLQIVAQHLVQGAGLAELRARTELPARRNTYLLSLCMRTITFESSQMKAGMEIDQNDPRLSESAQAIPNTLYELAPNMGVRSTKNERKRKFTANKDYTLYYKHQRVIAVIDHKLYLIPLFSNFL